MMKMFANLRRKEWTFEKGKWAFIWFQTYQQMLVSPRENTELFPWFYGLFKIIDKGGSVAYRLDLLESSQVYSIFHVSLFKKKLGQANIDVLQLLMVDEKGVLKPQPEAILDRRVWNHGSLPLTKLLVQWQGQSNEEALWEGFQNLKNTYPHLVSKMF